MNNRHIIIRSIITVIWIVVGIISLVRHQMMPGIISLAAAVLFALSVFSMLKKK